MFKMLIGRLEEKVKVTSLDIIVTEKKEKPYFEIRYKKVGEEDYNIGYGSYDLNNVFGWKDACFEIVDQPAEEYNKRWIPVGSDIYPAGDGYILLSFSNFSVPLVGRYEEDEEGGAFYVGDDEESCVSQGIIVNAWQPLPAPYQPKEDAADV